MKETRGNLILALKTGECLAAQVIRIAGETLEIEKGISPSKETLTFLLTENPLRYSPYPDEDNLKAIQRNTTWFLNTFPIGLNWKAILQTCSDKSRKEQLEAGLTPPSGAP